MRKFLNNKVVFTNGCFDILHRGHIEYLAAAADLGSILIVGLNDDDSVKRLKGEGRPLNVFADRALALASLGFVDAVCGFSEDTPENLIEEISPDILVKGGDYKIEDIVGADFVKTNGGTVAVIDFTAGYSTTHFLEKIRKES
ncbi:MAG: D-glycero-beta-D-manno-heptose 1-phosphate adenylyltransferase [Bacteroidia bacterium]